MEQRQYGYFLLGRLGVLRLLFLDWRASNALQVQAPLFASSLRDLAPTTPKRSLRRLMLLMMWGLMSSDVAHMLHHNSAIYDKHLNNVEVHKFNKHTR